MLASLIFIEIFIEQGVEKNRAKNGGNIVRDRIFSVQKSKLHIKLQ